MAEPRDFFTSPCSVPTCGILHSVAEHVLNRAIEQNTLPKPPHFAEITSFKVKDCTREEIENELKHRGILFDFKKRIINEKTKAKQFKDRSKMEDMTSNTINCSYKMRS